MLIYLTNYDSDYEPLDRYTSNFDWGRIGRTTGMFLAWF